MTGAFSTFIALYANYRDITDSSTLSFEGPMVTTSAVLELPPSESLRILVSLESLKGTWLFYLGSVNACMQLPSAASEKFIFFASSSLCAETYDFLTRSLPAKSTK